MNIQYIKRDKEEEENTKCCTDNHGPDVHGDQHPKKCVKFLKTEKKIHKFTDKFSHKQLRKQPLIEKNSRTYRV